MHLNAIFDIIMYTVYFLITVYTNKITNLYNDKEPIYELRQKATMQLLRKYDNKSSKVKNKFKLIVLKILLVVVIVAGAAASVQESVS